jgi:hypothetical protein
LVVSVRSQPADGYRSGGVEARGNGFSGDSRSQRANDGIEDAGSGSEPCPYCCRRPGVEDGSVRDSDGERTVAPFVEINVRGVKAATYRRLDGGDCRGQGTVHVPKNLVAGAVKTDVDGIIRDLHLNADSHTFLIPR